MLLFLVGIPFILYLFQNSLTSELSFEAYRGAVSSWLGKLVLLALIWAFIHHLLAGIRFLLLDLHIAGEREPGAMTARVVLGLSAVDHAGLRAAAVRPALTRPQLAASCPTPSPRVLAAPSAKAVA